ncbi:MAG: hypothetical protein ACOYN3_08480 [Acidimicrobiia bacterium]
MRINGNDAALSQLANRRADAAGDAQAAKAAKAGDVAETAATAKVESTNTPGDAETAAVAAQNARAAVSVALRTGRQVASVVARSTFDLRV